MDSDIVSATLAKLGSLWPSMILVLIALGMLLYSRMRERAKLAHLDIKNIDRLDIESFEKYLALIFKQKGFSLRKEKEISKFAVDFIVKSKNKQILIHTLRKRTGRFGVQDVRDAAAAGKAAGCDEAMIVTNGFFTKDAIVLATEINIEFWDQKRLIEELAKLKP
jgi:HJR/Mrr/RecB family endonuclease